MNKEISIPMNLEAEQYLLSRMLRSSNAVNLAIDSLTAGELFDPRHQSIFSVMSSLWSNDEVVEPSSVSLRLAKDFPAFSGDAYVFDLEMLDMGDAEDAKTFISLIKEEALRRRFLFLGQELVKSSNGDKKGEEIYNETLQKIDEIFSNNHSVKTKSLKEIGSQKVEGSEKSFLKFVEEKMEQRAKGINVLRGIPTGFPILDKTISGLCKGQFLILAARPGAGKTTFALNVMHQLAKLKISVGFFSLEMPAIDAYMKLACIDGGIEFDKISDGSLTHGEYQDLVVSSNNIEKLSIYIEDQESLNISQLISRTKRMISAYGIEVLFIDYIGELTASGKFSSRQEEMQAVSKAIRGMSKSLKLPVFCLAQLNRDSEKGDRTPKKSDLRETGQIEADAHVIIMLENFSEDSANPNSFPGRVKAHIVKNRYGKQCSIEFSFQGEISKFKEVNYGRQS